MSRIDDLFQNLRAQSKKALMPFITAGDPDLSTTADVLRLLSRSGAHLCEVGFPYSDPIADGPVIQASYTRALASKLKAQQILNMVREVQPALACPLVGMVSFAIVHRRGGEAFVDDAQNAGMAGAIIPDLPLEESAKLAAVCRERDFSLIQLVTPTTPRERALQIAETSSGFVYFVSVTGITGERRALPDGLLESVSWLRQRTPLPICIGFGVSSPEHAKLLAPAADGVIVGSAYVRRIAEAGAIGREAALANVEQFTKELLAAIA